MLVAHDDEGFHNRLEFLASVYLVYSASKVLARTLSSAPQGDPNDLQCWCIALLHAVIAGGGCGLIEAPPGGSRLNDISCIGGMQPGWVTKHWHCDCNAYSYSYRK